MFGRSRSFVVTLSLVFGAGMLFASPSQAQHRNRSRIYKGPFAPLLMDSTPFQYSPKLGRVVPILTEHASKPARGTKAHRPTARLSKSTTPKPKLRPVTPRATTPRATPKNVYRGSFSPLLMDDAEFRFNPKTGKVEEVY